MILSGMGRKSAYDHNVGILKKYSDNNYRLTIMNTIRAAGYEERNRPQITKKRGERENPNKLIESLQRSKRTVWELAMCNQWEYFVTLTINGEKMDRYHLDALSNKIGKWFNNYNARNEAVKYLLIPEHHKDGAWHLHGLLMGLPLSHLKLFEVQDHIPRRIKQLLENGRFIYDWPAYAKAFGYVTVEPVIDRERCAGYITKYITKELLETSIGLNAHVYYCSHGLKRAEELYRGQVTQGLKDPDFENEYVHIKTFRSAEEAMPYFCDKEEL